MMMMKMPTLCLKNDTDVAHYNFDADQPILIIFGRDVAELLREYAKLHCVPQNVHLLIFQITLSKINLF